jgi:hypothetical protein
MDEASGSGWLQLSSKDEVKGLIKMHGGDRAPPLKPAKLADDIS